jgi:hypothetical protein
MTEYLLKYKNLFTGIKISAELQGLDPLLYKYDVTLFMYSVYVLKAFCDRPGLIDALYKFIKLFKPNSIFDLEKESPVIEFDTQNLIVYFSYKRELK